MYLCYNISIMSDTNPEIQSNLYFGEKIIGEPVLRPDGNLVRLTGDAQVGSVTVYVSAVTAGYTEHEVAKIGYGNRGYGIARLAQEAYNRPTSNLWGSVWKPFRDELIG